MSTRITSAGPSTGVVSTATAARQTPPPARPFRQVVDEGARRITGGAEAAVRRLPGGPIVAAAFRTPGGATVSGPAVRAEGPTGTAAAPGAPGGGIESAISEHADRNLYYLRLQEQISAENRQYTAMSNVLKARHDTVKAAITNIRT